MTTTFVKGWKVNFAGFTNPLIAQEPLIQETHGVWQMKDGANTFLKCIETFLSLK